MKNNFNSGRESIRAIQEQKRVNKLIVKLLELLIKHYGVGAVVETNEILNQIREINYSVNIISRHLKRQEDDRHRLLPESSN